MIPSQYRAFVPSAKASGFISLKVHDEKLSVVILPKVWGWSVYKRKDLPPLSLTWPNDILVVYENQKCNISIMGTTAAIRKQRNEILDELFTYKIKASNTDLACFNLDMPLSASNNVPLSCHI